MNSELNELIADIREQVLYLQELGVDALDVKVESEEWKVESAEVPRPTANPIPDNIFARETSKPAESRPAGSRLASLPSLTNRQSPGMTNTPDDSGDVPKSFKEIEESATKYLSLHPNSMANEDVLDELTPAEQESKKLIMEIRAEIGLDCTRCKLSTLGRSKVVNSTGNFNSDLMFVGEAPGADEDEQGEPFVGRAGQLLTKIIEGIGLQREDVFIGNINRCRPPGNRAPEPDESVACKPFLKREIAVVRPKVIVVLGATAAQNLLETKMPIGKLRGHFHDYLGVKVMPTFHPAYLLRDPHKKREVWEDMKMVRDYLNSTQ